MGLTTQGSRRAFGSVRAQGGAFIMSETASLAAYGDLRIAVVVASCGRPAEVGQLIEQLARQTHQPERVVLSVVNASDVPSDLPSAAIVVCGSKGLPAQRNRGLERVLNEVDIVAFFDDDYLPSDRALDGIARLFSSRGDVVGINGELLADGINSPGVDYEDAIAMIRRYDASAFSNGSTALVDLDGLYGCNMVFRAAAIGDIRFDETLPLYAWQEDIDFSARLRQHGRIVTSRCFAGVHRGVKSSRTSGVRLGYSQIANPIYLWRKGTMRLGFAVKIAVKNILANHARVLRPEPWIDRWGRLKGNWLALRDVLTGRDHPTRILEIA
jgi:GT2 family glycosyltransferase